MKKTINECVGCDNCIDCGRRHVTVHVCDLCGYEIDDAAYDLDGKFVCEECLLDNLKIKERDWDRYND